jgi:hypothetical protein
MLRSRRVNKRFQTSPTKTVCFIEAQLPDGQTWVRSTHDEYRQTTKDGTPLTAGQKRTLAEIGATIILLDKLDDYIMYGESTSDEEEDEVRQTEDRPLDRGEAAVEAYLNGVTYPEFCIVCNGRCRGTDEYYRRLGERCANGECV